MPTFVKVSELPVILRRYVRVDKHRLYGLDSLREIDIPWKELNRKEVVGREFGDCRYLSQGECKKVVEYLKENRIKLGERYRKIIWKIS